MLRLLVLYKCFMGETTGAGPGTEYRASLGTGPGPGMGLATDIGIGTATETGNLKKNNEFHCSLVLFIVLIINNVELMKINN